MCKIGSFWKCQSKMYQKMNYRGPKSRFWPKTELEKCLFLLTKIQKIRNLFGILNAEFYVRLKSFSQVEFLDEMEVLEQCVFSVI